MHFMKRVVLGLLLVILTVHTAEPDSRVTPGEVFGKVFHYDRALGRAAQWNVFIVGAPSGDAGALELAQSFRDAGIRTIVVWNGESLEVRDGGQIVVLKDGGKGFYTDESWSRQNSVVFTLPGADLARVEAFCVKSGVLSVASVPAMAEAGHVSVSVVSKAESTDLIVNLTRLKQEGHHLSAELLRVARVIR